MRTKTKAILASLAGVAALWVGWGLYQTRHTERVPYETIDQFDDIETRRYPQTLLVETRASDPQTAFRRLFRYLSGANEQREDVSMTAPVVTRGETLAMPAPVRAVSSGGESVSMTAPVRTDRREDGTTMSFYLPPEYTPESAPIPTDPEVRLVVEPARTVAVRSFSWYATAPRVEREELRLLEALDDAGIEPLDEPTLFQYNDPWTPPFLRTNEVVVTIDGSEG